MIPAAETALLALAGICPFPRLLARRTKDCRSISMPKNRTCSSCPGLRISSRFSMRMQLMPMHIRATQNTRFIVSDLASKDCSPASSDGRDAAMAISTGDRYQETTFLRSMARTLNLASPIQMILVESSVGLFVKRGTVTETPSSTNTNMKTESMLTWAMPANEIAATKAM